VNAQARDLKAKIWERDPLDWYVEPESVSDALFRAERFSGNIWDPACGAGNVIWAAIRAGYGALGTDIKRRSSALWFHSERDFLAADQALAQNIVCNPPFFRATGAEAFIRKALCLARGKVAMFLDIRFLAGADRASGLYAEHPPHRVWVVTPRVSCPPGEYLAAGNKAANGSADWCWLVWDLLAPAPAHPELRWLKEVGR
jgi:hypothetical protein